jgi:SNF2 family DNA or RNA helicase
LVEDFDTLPDAALPQTLVSKLRDYQRVGVNWLVFLKRAGLGALLADDMGLGKTLQALCAIEGRSLVVAPTSVLRNWIHEAERFRSELSLCHYHGPRRELDEQANLTITSHALLRLDRDKLSAVDWDTVVIDEAQAIRNPETDLARAAFALRARFRVSLTGTPIENRLNDLWSQLHFLNPGLLGGLSDFGRRYVRPIEAGETEPLERLRERLRPFFLRRLKREVAPELPPRTETTLWSELSESEKGVYEAVRLAARRDVLARLEKKGSVLAALEALLRLRQAACHPALVPGQKATTSSKTELLLDSLETASAEGHKSLVFSQWTSMLDLIEPHLLDRDLPFLRLDGSTRERGAVVQRFQEDEGTSVFLISLKAGGTGLNLTAADHVFLFDPWWNPAVEEQAFDRAHRIGQDKPVFVHRLVASGTVEERILALQEEKKRLADMATGRAAAGLTRDDLMRLIE